MLARDRGCARYADRRVETLPRRRRATMARMRPAVLLALATAACTVPPPAVAGGVAPDLLDAYDVVWTTPSADASRLDADRQWRGRLQRLGRARTARLCFYVSRTDSFSEACAAAETRQGASCRSARPRTASPSSSACACARAASAWRWRRRRGRVQIASSSTRRPRRAPRRRASASPARSPCRPPPGAPRRGARQATSCARAWTMQEAPAGIRCARAPTTGS